MRKILLAVAATLGLLAAGGGVANASPAHQAKAAVAQTSCSSRVIWEPGWSILTTQPLSLGWNTIPQTIVDFNRGDFAQIDFCQLYNSGTGLFEYQDPTSGNCMTWNNGGSGITGGYLDEIGCSWLAAQSWSAIQESPPGMCAGNGNHCYYLQGNLYVAQHNNGDGEALTDNGYGNSPVMEPWTSGVGANSQTWYNLGG